jgi:very-short-patch-repair endonuclease
MVSRSDAEVRVVGERSPGWCMGKKPLAPDHLKNARRLRREMSIPERVLWKYLRDRRLGGLKFRRQHPIGPFVADFYCHDAKLVVEIDSGFHLGRQEEDARRTEWLESQGLAVIRTSASEISSDVLWCWDGSGGERRRGFGRLGTYGRSTSRPSRLHAEHPHLGPAARDHFLSRREREA